MKILRAVLVACCFALVFKVNLVFPQNAAKSKRRPDSPPPKVQLTDSKKAEPGDHFPEDEIKSPFRYVVVYENVIFEDDEEKVPSIRQIQVLMEPRAFNKTNLIYLFRYLAGYYASPEYLDIEVHTSLMTLETLEESSAMSTHSGRDDFRHFYKTASYTRFNDGTEAFLYDTGRSGKFVVKFVKLTRTSKEK